MLISTSFFYFIGAGTSRFRLLLLLLLSAIPSLAQTAPRPTAAAVSALQPDARPAPHLRRPDAGRLRELRGQRAFQYEGEVTQPEQSAWDAFWARVRDAIGNWLVSRSYSHFWRWIFYALFVGAGAFIVLRLLEIDFTAILGRSPRRTALAYDTMAENIHEVDFATRLADAEAAGNWRLAVRLGYLQLLKNLADSGLINWQPDKTNHAYMAELPAAGPLRGAFREATRQFEYVWYGELALTAPLYAQVRAGFLALRAQLSNFYSAT